MKKNTAFIALALAGIALASFFLWQKQDSPAQTAAPGPAPQALAVSVLEMAKQDTRIQYELPGRLTPYRQSQVRPQVDGVITKRLFEEGGRVKAGQQLYQIDDARYRATYRSALADLKSAQSNLATIQTKETRYRDLLKTGAISEQGYDNVKAELDQAQAAIAVAQSAVDLAKVNLDYTKMYAPISGRIGRSLVSEGALVTANQAQHLAVITQLDPIYVDIQQSSSEAMTLRAYVADKDHVPVRLRLGDEVKSEYPHAGVLKFSEVTVDETSGSISLRAQIPNPDATLLPGLFVSAQLDLGQYALLLLPQRAAIRQPDGSLMVWTLDADNRAQPRPISAQYEYQKHWIVRTGLSPGDRVIVEGYQKVQPGMPVEPVPWAPQAAGQAPTDAAQPSSPAAQSQ